jgi:ABC-type bacteriocin/lantibiotic exporter with double-glycine peptidase domain
MSFACKKSYWSKVDKNSCGVSVIAMVTNNRFIDVKKKLHSENIFYKKYLLNKKRLLLGLKLWGIEVKSQKKFSSWQEIKSHSVIATDFQNNGSFHWILFVRKNKHYYFILDPAIPNIEVTRFSYYKPKYYLELAVQPQ